MRWVVGSKAATGAGRRGQRGEERFRTDLLRSTLGDVIDLSGSGVRVRHAGRPRVAVGQVVPVTLESDECRIVLKSRVVRMRRVGLRTFEIAVTFTEIKPGLRAALHHLARFGFIPNLHARGGGGGGETQSGGARHTSTLPDYYGLLRIPPTATPQQVRAAYHEAAQRYHPDAVGSADRAFMFQAVTEAYRVLRDTGRRADYDVRRLRQPDAA